MPHFTTTARVNVSADQAFAIGADVASYKEFLPLLKRSVIRGERRQNGTEESFDADLQVALEKLGFRESFTSHVVTNSEKLTVVATSSDGPLKSLRAVWTITAVGSAQADVTIAIDYVLKNAMLQMMVGGMMGFATQKIMQAFEARGQVLYGKLL